VTICTSFYVILHASRKCYTSHHFCQPYTNHVTNLHVCKEFILLLILQLLFYKISRDIKYENNFKQLRIREIYIEEKLDSELDSEDKENIRTTF